MNKAMETLQSRKFWVTVVVSVTSVGLFKLGYIDAEKMLAGLTIGLGVYVGSLGIEDAAKKLLPALLELAGGYTEKGKDK